MLRQGETGTEILCQGRVEPGNVEIMQLAPTIQSTEANIKQLHGGKAPPLVEWFTQKTEAKTIIDGLQSEEGSRYYGKYNRNVAFLIPTNVNIELPANFRWFDLFSLRELVQSNNIFNTDARSVLACLDWDYLVQADELFSQNDPDSFGHKLYESYKSDLNSSDSNIEILHWLAKLRSYAAIRHQIIPLDQVSNWVIDETIIKEIQNKKGFAIRQFEIVAIGREVSTWDQPLIDSIGVGLVSLFCQNRDGILQFLVKADYEEGYLEGVQISATISIPPGEIVDINDPIQRGLSELLQTSDNCSIVISCRQSEEGGRFYQDQNDYSIVELDQGLELTLDDDYRWLTLKQIKQLINIPGVFAIEFRNAITLLLAYC